MNPAEFPPRIRGFRPHEVFLIVSEKDGVNRFMDFTQDSRQMPYIFESFVHNFYKREQRTFRVFHECISWDVHSENDVAFNLLPKMHTDISLINDQMKIIIDAKFYTQTLQERYGTKKIHSPNLYQMFSYISNSRASTPIPHWGILLYPVVGYETAADYSKETTRISIRTIDLSKDWETIHASLISILK